MFGLYEKVLIDFDDNGRPELPTMMCGQDMMKQFQSLQDQIRFDPETNKRFILAP